MEDTVVEAQRLPTGRAQPLFTSHKASGKTNTGAVMQHSSVELQQTLTFQRVALRQHYSTTRCNAVEYTRRDLGLPLA